MASRALACALLLLTASATLRLPTAISSQMVLQRANATLWGWSLPDASVAVVIKDSSGRPLQSAQTVADTEGAWLVTVQQPALINTSVVFASAGETITLTEVAFGDVYLCSGQSNMKYPVADALNGAEERLRSTYSGLRLLNLRDESSSVPKDDVISSANYTWAVSAPGNLSPRSTGGSFGEAYPSAVCYFAGRDILVANNHTVPVGLITAAWSGSAIEHWMTPEMVRDGIPPALGGNGSCGGSLQRTTAAAAPNSTCPSDPEGCGGMFNGMIAPLARMRLSAVLWYQGEENDHPDEPCGPQYYSCLFPAMITAWRRRFQSPRLPFYFVLLAGGHTALMRQAQSAARSLDSVEFASAMDLSATSAEEIIPGHPPRKQEVGRRLALIAQAQIYGMPVQYRGPTVVLASARMQGSTLIANLTFDPRLSLGLHMNGTAACTQCCSSRGSPVRFTDLGTPGANSTVAGVYSVVQNSLIARGDWAMGSSEVLIEFQFADMVQCALYSGVGAGPDSHTGLVAESWRGDTRILT